MALTLEEQLAHEKGNVADGLAQIKTLTVENSRLQKENDAFRSAVADAVKLAAQLRVRLGGDEVDRKRAIEEATVAKKSAEEKLAALGG